MENLLFNKGITRQLLKEKLERIAPARKKRAQEKLLTLPLPCETILSFASLKNEIDTSLLNVHLLKQGRLFLPKMVDKELWIYHVTNSQHLKPNQFGILEPDPLHYQRVSLSDISLVLVPGLGFDSLHHRLGRGGGYYDRLLKKTTKSWGLGFTEQFLPQLPIEAHDIPLSATFLF